MKKLSIIILTIILAASLAFAVPPSPPSSTTGGTIGATINDSAGNGDNTVVYSADKVFDLLALKQAALSLIAGTYTNGYLCKYTTAGTLLDCNVDPAGYQTVDTELAAIAALANGAGALTNDGAGAMSWVSYQTPLTAGSDYAPVSGTPTDEFVVCWEDDGGVWKQKACGAKVSYLTKTIYLPVAYFEDGAAAPATAAVTASTRKVKTRAFDGSSNENLEVSFTAPMDFKASGTIKFRVIGYVTAATAPADTEVVAFSLAGCSNGNSDALGCTAGTAVTSSLTVAGSGYAQNDRLATDWSAAVTVTDLAAGETVQAILIRLADSTDTYVQDFAVAGIEIKYIADIKTEASY